MTFKNRNRFLRYDTILFVRISIPFISVIFLDFIPFPPPPLTQTLLRIWLQHLPFLSQKVIRPLGLCLQSLLVVHSKISFLKKHFVISNTAVTKQDFLQILIFWFGKRFKTVSYYHSNRKQHMVYLVLLFVMI